MAEQPARQTGPYDNDASGQPVTRPDLRSQEGIGNSTAGGKSGGSTSGTGGRSGGASSGTGSRPGGANSGTSSAGGGATSGTGGGTPSQYDNGLKDAEEGAGGDDDQVGKGYTPGKNSNSTGKGKSKFRITRRRALISLGGAGVISAIISFVSIGTGPAQFVQLSELLAHNFTVSQSDSESRTDHLLRSYKAYKTGDYRYTRVGLIGQRVMARVVGQFEDAGVKFTGSDVLGRPTKIEIDQDKVAENHPEVKDMDSEAFDNWLNENFGVDSGTSFKSGELDIGGLKAQAISSFINNTSTELLGNDKVVSAVKLRSLKNFFGLGSLFHPFSRALQNKISAKADEIKKANPKESEGDAENKAESDVADSAYDSSVSTVEEPGVKGFSQAKGEEDDEEANVGSKLLPGFGLLYAGGCTLKGVSGAIVAMNRYLIVLPAAVEATQLIGMGSQIQNGGNDVSVAQLGAVEKGFTNSQGQSIWSGDALQTTEGYNNGGQTKNDLPGEYKQAFGTDSTASTLNSAGDVMLSWFPLHYISGVIPGGQCGLIGGATILVAGLATQAAVAIANAPDGEAGDIALNAAANAGDQTLIQGVQGQLLGPVINNIIDRIAKATVAPKLTRAAFSGALGGNLIAYGARAAANSSAMLSGGLSLANNTSTIIGSAGQEQQQQFHSESFFARMFDINDYRSLAGHLAADISPDIGSDIQLGVNSILNIGGTLASVFGNLIPHVAADDSSNSWTGNYNWSFAQDGIPDNMLNDPALSDPYQNLEDVGQYLSSACTDGSGNIGPSYGACGGSNGYTARIMDCFGNNLTYSEDSDVGGEVWDVAHAATAASSDVNPVSDTYLGANCGGICPDTIADCGNSAEEQWEKIVMFVNDAWNIKALDCTGGYTDTSDQSCSDIDPDSSSGSGSGSGSNSPATGVQGNGSGKFTTNTSLAPYPGLNQMLARVKAATSSSAGAAAFCASIGGCSGKCESAVEMAWLGHRGEYADPFGNAGDTPSADSAWAAALASGHAHPGDRNPPVGALLIYNHHDPSDPLGHITIYLGNNLVFSTDFDHQGSVGIDPASDIETGSWANSYVGWMDPYFGGQVGSP